MRQILTALIVLAHLVGCGDALSPEEKEVLERREWARELIGFGPEETLIAFRRQPGRSEDERNQFLIVLVALDGRLVRVGSEDGDDVAWFGAASAADLQELQRAIDEVKLCDFEPGFQVMLDHSWWQLILDCAEMRTVFAACNIPAPPPGIFWLQTPRDMTIEAIGRHVERLAESATDQREPKETLQAVLDIEHQLLTSPRQTR